MKVHIEYVQVDQREWLAYVIKAHDYRIVMRFTGETLPDTRDKIVNAIRVRGFLTSGEPLVTPLRH